MTWAVIPGAPHGGPLPSVQIDSISPRQVVEGDTITILGSGFSPGTTIVLNPGNILAGTSMPTVTDEITFKVPTNITNMRYVVTLRNDVSSAQASFFLIRDIAFSSATGQSLDVLISEMN